jgi:hypothetical protein
MRIAQIIEKIETWASQNYLKLNKEKTQAIAFASKTLQPQLRLLPPIQLKSESIPIQLIGKSLGVTLDSGLTMNSFISSTRRSAFVALCSIRQMRNYLDPTAMKMLVHAFVLSRVDYCAVLLISLPLKTTNRLQVVINSAARLVSGKSRYTHISPTLCELQWLKMVPRVKYKVLIIVQKLLQEGTPHYLKEIIKPYIPSRSLRSAEDNQLCVTLANSTMARQAFHYAAPTIWNNLPKALRVLEDRRKFCKQLYLYLLNEQT